MARPAFEPSVTAPFGIAQFAIGHIICRSEEASVRITPTLLAAAAAVSMSGCGTVCNLARGFDHPDTDPKVYGGVAMDMEFLGKVAGASASETEVADPRMWAAILGLGFIDPAFSLVGDTVTLPITVPLQNKRLRAMDKKNRADAEATPSAATQADNVRRVEPLPEAPSKENVGP